MSSKWEVLSYLSSSGQQLQSERSRSELSAVCDLLVLAVRGDDHQLHNNGGGAENPEVH